jgi:hypothetical protein
MEEVSKQADLRPLALETDMLGQSIKAQMWLLLALAE